MKWITENRGQTLIEVLIAFATLAVVITSTTLAVISALNNAQFVKNQHLATEFAQQGMEIVRSIRDNNYDTFLQLTNPTNNAGGAQQAVYYCMAASCSSLSLLSGDPCGYINTSTCPNQNVANFTRTVRIDGTSQSSCASGFVSNWPNQVTVTVAWTDGQCPRGTDCHNVSVTSCIAPVINISKP